MSGPYFAVIPAAGRSQRMGTPKLLLPWKSHTVIEAMLAAWSAGGVEKRIVVVHPSDELVTAVARNAGAIVVVPPVPPPTMKDSVLAGLQYLEQHFSPPPTAGWLLAPADLPLLSPLAIKALLKQFSGTTGTILRARNRHGVVHPTLFSWDMAAAVEKLHPQVGVNALFAEFPPQDIAVPDEICDLDLDVPEQYHDLYNRYGR